MKWMRHLVVPTLCGAAALAFGCASNRPGDIPSNAEAVGDGSKLVYTATQDGTVWVTDVNTNSIVYTGPVHANDVVQVDPDHDRLTLNGQTLSSNNINSDEHQVYFLQGPSITPPPPVTPNASVNRPMGVSQQAMLKGEGNNLVQYTAAGRGVIWVTDEGSNTVLYSGRVAMGDQVVVDPNNNVLSINGNKVYGQDLTHNGHQIFFLPTDNNGSAMPGANY